MPLPTVYPLTVYAGDHWSREFRFTVKGSDPAVPVDLSGAHAAQVRRTPSGPLLASFDVDVSGAADGIVVLTLQAAASQGAAAGDPARELALVWDWQVVRAGDERPVTLLRGPLNLVRDVTRVEV